MHPTVWSALRSHTRWLLTMRPPPRRPGRRSMLGARSPTEPEATHIRPASGTWASCLPPLEPRRETRREFSGLTSAVERRLLAELLVAGDADPSSDQQVLGKEGAIPETKGIWWSGGQRWLDELQLADAYTNRIESLRDVTDLGSLHRRAGRSWCPSGRAAVASVVVAAVLSRRFSPARPASPASPMRPRGQACCCHRPSVVVSSCVGAVVASTVDADPTSNRPATAGPAIHFFIWVLPFTSRSSLSDGAPLPSPHRRSVT